MNKSLLRFGIILALGSAGCAGFGIQHASSLSERYNTAELGVDSLWEASESQPTQSREIELYAEQSLGSLWDSEARRERTVGQASRASQGSDLWNPATVSRPWEADEAVEEGRDRAGVSSSGLWY